MTLPLEGSGIELKATLKRVERVRRLESAALIAVTRSIGQDTYGSK
jgi:hypothetical protein